MPITPDEFVTSILALPLLDRMEVVERIEAGLRICKLIPDPAWSAELDRRYEEHVTGKDPGIPLAEFRRMMQKQLDEDDGIDP